MFRANLDLSSVAGIVADLCWCNVDCQLSDSIKKLRKHNSKQIRNWYSPTCLKQAAKGNTKIAWSKQVLA